MKFKAKLRKLGNSIGIIMPRDVITHIEKEHNVVVITAGDDIYLEVITEDEPYWEAPYGVITEGQGKVITPKLKPSIKPDVR